MNRGVARIAYKLQRFFWCVFYAFKLFYVFCWKLIKANIRLAAGILRVKPVFTSAIFSHKVEEMPAAEEFILTNLLSLTPGTLALDLKRDENLIYVHTLYADECDEAKDEIEELTDLIKLACGTKKPPRLRSLERMA